MLACLSSGRNIDGRPSKTRRHEYTPKDTLRTRRITLSESKKIEIKFIT